MTVRDDDWEPTLEDPEIQAYIREEVGEEGMSLAHFLQDHPHISGVDIVDHFKEQKPSAVRKVLYRMMEAHVAEYAKDTDSKGWETFLWDLDLNEVKFILRRRWADELLNLRKQLKFEEDHQFYACKSQHRRILFEDAIDLQFICPACNEPMEAVRTNQLKQALQERIEELAPHFPQIAQ
ncbi:MAG: transcription initiation factor subunit alpha [Thermoplasmata archaeon]|jgi:transcription factor E|nr:transcription initiation factor subunit alpha [Thermoplasmata archaeon]